MIGDSGVGRFAGEVGTTCGALRFTGNDLLAQRLTALLTSVVKYNNMTV
jgi:hypothetical protein